MQPIPLDTSDFTYIRQHGQKYIDKTGYLHRLITDPNCHVFFLSRPRRFGKSLMISTLKAIFQGRKELFEGLDIARTDYGWTTHPVINLNMGFCASENYDQFAQNLPREIERGLAEAVYEYDESRSYANNFGHAIDLLADSGRPPVIRWTNTTPPWRRH